MWSSLAGTSHYIKRFTRVYSSAQICHYSTPERRTIELLPAAPGELYAVRGEKASCWLQPTNSPQSISIRRLHNQHSAILEPQHIPRTVDEWQPPRSIIIEGNNREREREREFLAQTKGDGGIMDDFASRWMLIRSPQLRNWWLEFEPGDLL